ncbi:succinate dehydrogenase cytochrome b subunit [Lentisphaera profundi]|uniref:Succinate dehydrogenase cytochrome b subunit n=1 Tax=Lentisphaera profundi TaxID=1658616 RepID=A0ABY7VVY5_9BACT|nr:succinate dehydrogenase cytochrome b subunit [Lentisphaera profundi]WDE98388.1 succinate dehydrogenase cytochrome b subunit [Lentisphaera profundi]
MSKCKCRFISSTIGMKVLMAATGLLLTGFLVTHLAGNFLLLPKIGGPAAFNDYAYKLTSMGPVLWAAEFGLLALFCIHIFCAIRTKMLSAAARGSEYVVRKTHGESTLSSRFMVHTGGVILVFLILHLVTFKFGTEYTQEATATSPQMRDLYKTVVELFANKLYSAYYIVSMILLGFHLKHGFQSAFQTLGLNHPRYTPFIKKTALALALIFAVGYSIFPVYFGFINPVDCSSTSCTVGAK